MKLAPLSLLLVSALFACCLAAGCSDSNSADKTPPDTEASDATQDVAADETSVPDTAAPEDQHSDAANDTSPDATAADTDAPAPLPKPLKVMSFNLRNGMAMDGDNSWKIRKEIVFHFLAAERPDIIGTQEAYPFQVTDLTTEFPNYAWVGIGRNNSPLVDIDEACIVFYDTNRFSLEDSDTFWLSDTPNDPATKFSDNQGYPRIVTWARLLDKSTGISIYHFNTHYDLSEEDNIPQRSSALIVTKIAEIAGDSPVTLSGDFNQYVDSPAYQILVGQADWDGVSGTLLDPWRELSIPEEGSFHGFTGVATSNLRIDWLLHSAHYTALEGVVSHYNENNAYPTDHFPVWVKLELK